MNLSQRSRALVHVLLLICAGLCSSATFAQSYLVTVDTSAIAGTDGYVNFQFNPADLLAPSADASILQWAGSITLLGAPLIEGSVNGALPGTVSLNNGTAFNDYFHAAQFGEAFSFVLQLTGNVSNPASVLGTSFALALYAADAVTPLLSGDISGSILRFELSPDGVDYETFGSVQVSPVPLPAAVWLLLSGVIGLLGMARSRN
jgi:hypothetical protein